MEKNGKFSEMKRNGTEKNYKIKKKNGKPQETKRNITILFRNEKTKLKRKQETIQKSNEKPTVPTQGQNYSKVTLHTKAFLIIPKKNQKRNETKWFEKRNEKNIEFQETEQNETITFRKRNETIKKLTLFNPS
jgi:hypothetical protein